MNYVNLSIPKQDKWKGEITFSWPERILILFKGKITSEGDTYIGMVSSLVSWGCEILYSKKKGNTAKK